MTAPAPINWVTGQNVTATSMNTLGAAVNASSHGANVKNFGAVGNDVNDDTAAVQAAVNAAVTSSDRCVYFPAGGLYRISTVTLPAVPITIRGYGATIRSTGTTSYVFTQTTRNLVEILGLRFIGTGNGFFFNMAPSGTQFYDIHICDCRFQLPANRIALNITGAREGMIRDCYFDNCTGIYEKSSINIIITGCQFRNCTVGVNCDGSTTGAATDAGAMISNCTALGCGIAMAITCWDYFEILNCMIDFNDHPIQITNSTGGSVVDTYVSARNIGATSFPAIEIISDGALPQNGFSQHVKVMGCTIINHSTVGNITAIQLTGSVSFTHILNNTIHFWKNYGIRSTGTPTGLWIKDNRIIGVGGAIVAAIAVPNGSNFTRIEGNVTPQAITGTGAGIVVRDNFSG